MAGQRHGRKTHRGGIAVAHAAGSPPVGRAPHPPHPSSGAARQRRRPSTAVPATGEADRRGRHRRRQRGHASLGLRRLPCMGTCRCGVGRFPGPGRPWGRPAWPPGRRLNRCLVFFLPLLPTAGTPSTARRSVSWAGSDGLWLPSSGPLPPPPPPPSLYTLYPHPHRPVGRRDPPSMPDTKRQRTLSSLAAAGAALDPRGGRVCRAVHRDRRRWRAGRGNGSDGQRRPRVTPLVGTRPP